MPLQGSQTTLMHYVFQATATICDVESCTVASGGEGEWLGHRVVCQPQRLLMDVKQNAELAIFPCVFCISESGSGVIPKNKGMEAPSFSSLMPESQGCILPALIGYSISEPMAGSGGPSAAWPSGHTNDCCWLQITQHALSILMLCPLSAMPFGILSVWQTG